MYLLVALTGLRGIVPEFSWCSPHRQLQYLYSTPQILVSEKHHEL